MSASQGNWTYQVGVWMFFVPVVAFVLVPVLVPLLDLDAGTTAAVVGGLLVAGELIWLASIPLLGKDGFHQLKKMTFSILKIPPGSVSRRRHYLGVSLFLGAFIAESLVVLFLVFGYFYYPPREYPNEQLLGLAFEDQALLFVVAQCMSALSVVVSLYALGGGFVDRLQELFRWHGSVE